MIHHLQAPVSINWHGITYKENQLVRHNSKCINGLRYWLLTFFLFVRASRAAAVTRFQAMVLTIQVRVQTTVNVQVGVTVK